jgi:excisionase family DNA binding protein
MNATPDQRLATEERPLVARSIVSMPKISETEQLPRLLVGVTEAAQALGISRSYAYELVASGFLASVRLGRRVLVPVSAIEDLVARGLDGL